ncbi:MAG: hypothetical protein HFI67_02650 [Lachnospiraceae bacterium]|nr:hypothetical protein [Lachnospiraceae bacterium]
MKRRGRLLSLLLVISLLAGMIPATVFAEPGTSQTAQTAGRKGAVQLVDSANPSGGIKGYDKESDQYQYLYYGYWGRTLKWQVLDSEKTNTGAPGMFLLSAEPMSQFREILFSDDGGNDWKTSDVRDWCRSFAGDQDPSLKYHLVTDFSSLELAAILKTDKDDKAVQVDQNLYLDPIKTYEAVKNNLQGDQFFVLSVEEAMEEAYGFSRFGYNMRNNLCIYNLGKREISRWWLRSPEKEGNVGLVAADLTGATARGTIWAEEIQNERAYVRPAFNLDMDKVLFTAPAASKGAEGGLKEVAEETPSEWKLTLKDNETGSGRENFKAERSDGSTSPIVAGSRVDISYSSAKKGSDEYISAMIVDGDRNVLYYGQICSVADTGSGTAQITIPAKLPGGGYTLKVFNEQCNDVERTNYASNFSDIPIVVKDDEPPVVKAEPAVRFSDEKAEVTFTSNEAGTYYYEAVEKNAAPPVVDTTGSGKPCGIEEETIHLDNLKEGTAYALYLVVKDKAGNETPLTVDIPEKITPVTTIFAAPDSLSFDAEEENYEAASEKTVTIENTGNQTITLTQPVLKNYVVGPLSQTTLDSGKTAEFTVRPKTGLGIGTYPEELVVSGSSADGGLAEAKISVSFEVTEEMRYSILVDQTALHFDSAAEGYERPEAKTVTVTNTGNQDIRLNKSTETARFDDRPFAISSFSEVFIGPNETASFTVQPKAGLSKGTYEETITISGSRRADDATAKVTAEFTVTDPSSKTYTITTSVEGEGGTITPPSTVVEEGGSAAFTVTPEEGYEVERVLVDGTKDVTDQLSDQSEYTFQNVEQNHIIQAAFRAVSNEPAVTHTVSVSANPEAGGRAAVPGGGVRGTYNEGSRVLVTATANAGYRFMRWTENGNTVSESANYEFELSSDRNLTAVFEAETPAPTPASHTVKVNSSYAQTSGAGTYATGTTVTIQAGIRQNYRFDGWTTEDGVTFANANSATTTFTMPDKDVTVAAKWTYTGSTGTNAGTGNGTNSGTTPGNNTSTGGKDGVYTGDDTPTAMWICGLCTSLGLMAALAVLYLRERRLSEAFVGQWRGLTEKEFGGHKRK